MRRSSTLALLVFAACSGDDPTDGGAPEPTTDESPQETGTIPAETSDTGTPPTDSTPPTGTDVVSCAVGMNPLVVQCTADLAVEATATLVLTAKGAATRTFVDDVESTSHALDGWGLLPETTYDWELAGQSGQVTTGSLPAGLNGLDVDVSGTLFGADGVLVFVDCGWFVLLDSDGRVIWAQPTSAYTSLSDGMRWVQDTRSILVVQDSTMSFDQSLVVETNVVGDELLRLEPGDFRLDLTHDADRWGTLTYLLGEDNVMGGFEVFDGTTKLGEWLLTDGFPGTPDLIGAHVNGLSVSETGVVVISAYNFDSLIGVDGDPASPTFLEVLWVAAGNPGGDDFPSPTYVPAGPDLFERQHNGSLHGDKLWVFDNQSQGDSRALRMTMDDVAGTISQDASWSTGQFCANQGGALPIDGGALVTCANSGDVYAFAEGQQTPEWTMNASCAGGGFGLGVSTRAYPVFVE